MLDVILKNVAFRYQEGFALQDISATFARSTHTALIGPAGCGSSTLLRVIAGEIRNQEGEIHIGSRRVDSLRPARRPLLHVTSAIAVSPRWSVQHALIAAVRTRTLDREDRHHEYQLAAERWDLEGLLDRRIAALSATERTRVHLARIELLRPAILLADRLLELVNPAEQTANADAFYRLLRVIGCSVISAPASHNELALTDAVVVLERGRIVQRGTAADVFRHPVSEAAARATGEADAIPITIRGSEVESSIGAWTVAQPPFQGDGVALVRPADFTIAPSGEGSDLIFGIEEAGFESGRWLAHGLVSGGVRLTIALPGHEPVHKGRLIPLQYDPSRFVLLQRDRDEGMARNTVPLLRESR